MLCADFAIMFLFTCVKWLQMMEGSGGMLEEDDDEEEQKRSGVLKHFQAQVDADRVQTDRNPLRADQYFLPGSNAVLVISFCFFWMQITAISFVPDLVRINWGITIFGEIWAWVGKIFMFTLFDMSWLDFYFPEFDVYSYQFIFAVVIAVSFPAATSAYHSFFKTFKDKQVTMTKFNRKQQEASDSLEDANKDSAAAAKKVADKKRDIDALENEKQTAVKNKERAVLDTSRTKDRVNQIELDPGPLREKEDEALRRLRRLGAGREQLFNLYEQFYDAAHRAGDQAEKTAQQEEDRTRKAAQAQSALQKQAWGKVEERQLALQNAVETFVQRQLQGAASKVALYDRQLQAATSRKELLEQQQNNLKTAQNLLAAVQTQLNESSRSLPKAGTKAWFEGVIRAIANKDPELVKRHFRRLANCSAELATANDNVERFQSRREKAVEDLEDLKIRYTSKGFYKEDGKTVDRKDFKKSAIETLSSGSPTVWGLDVYNLTDQGKVKIAKAPVVESLLKDKDSESGLETLWTLSYLSSESAVQKAWLQMHGFKVKYDAKLHPKSCMQLCNKCFEQLQQTPDFIRSEVSVSAAFLLKGLEKRIAVDFDKVMQLADEGDGVVSKAEKRVEAFEKQAEEQWDKLVEQLAILRECRREEAQYQAEIDKWDAQKGDVESEKAELDTEHKKVMEFERARQSQFDDAKTKVQEEQQKIKDASVGRQKCGKLYAFFDSLTALLYMGVMRILAKGLACKGFSGHGQEQLIHLEQKEACFVGWHRFVAPFSLIGLICLYPSAMLTRPLFQALDTRLNLKFNYNYIFVFIQLQTLTLLVSVFFPNRPAVLLSVCLFTDIVLIWYFVQHRPCTSQALNTGAARAFGFSACLNIVSFIVAFKGTDVGPSLALFVYVGAPKSPYHFLLDPNPEQETEIRMSMRTECMLRALDLLFDAIFFKDGKSRLARVRALDRSAQY
eukprot:g1055.t1